MYIIHRKEDRGTANHELIHSSFSFSFANWYNPDKMGFGLLRVLNDDVILQGGGFGMHYHDNFEIITIVQKGIISHEDNMGNKKEITAGEIQVMSAGTGVMHSEFNLSKEEPVELLQIWIEPNVKNRYGQMKFSEKENNKWQLLISGKENSNSLMIYQDARIFKTNIDKNIELEYKIFKKENGVYCFIVKGEIEVIGEKLIERDAIGIWDIDNFSVKAISPASLIVIEVPMK